MKKLVFSLGAVVMLSMVSCDKKETKIEPATEKTATDSVAQETQHPAVEEAVGGALSEVSKFSNAEIQKFAKEYAVYQKEFVTAYKTKDAAKMFKVDEKSGDWIMAIEEKEAKMSAEDLKLWKEWTERMAQEAFGDLP